jgi:hypothetical protein
LAEGAGDEATFGLVFRDFENNLVHNFTVSRPGWEREIGSQAPKHRPFLRLGDAHRATPTKRRHTTASVFALSPRSVR